MKALKEAVHLLEVNFKLAVEQCETSRLNFEHYAALICKLITS